MRMRYGRTVFAPAVEGMVMSAQEALITAGLGATEIATWVPHQANQRILDKVKHRLDLSGAECLGTLARHGNSSAATIPLALSCRIAEQGALRTGPILFSAFGAGALWGSVVWQH